MTKIFDQLNQKQGLTCETYECGECGLCAIVPPPHETPIICECGHLLLPQEEVRIKTVPLNEKNNSQDS